MKLNFDTLTGLIPAIVQDDRNRQMLMLGYMNAEALAATRESGWVTFYSRSRQAIWVKGATSGNKLKLVSIKPDCDRDALLIRVIPQGPTCHTGAYSCFGEDEKEGFLNLLESTIQHRKATPKADSYTTALFESGINRIAQKVGEEAVELIIESKDADLAKFESEAADLLYHFLVLLVQKNSTIKSVEAILAGRDK